MRWLALMAVLCAVNNPIRAATPAAVDQSIQKAKEFIYKYQKPNGSWESADAPDPDAKPIAVVGGQFGGRTAMAVYSLLSAGEEHQDPRLVKAVQWLRDNEARGVYALGLRCNVWLQLPPSPENRQAMRTDLQKLLKSMKTQGEARGMYDYVESGPGGTYSHSRSQYAVLGVWAAAQYGLEIPRSYWEIVEAAWLDHQDPSGGWAYQKKPKGNYPVSVGMTTVGVATLYITMEYLHANDGIACRGNLSSEPINKAMNWIGDNFDQFKAERDRGLNYHLPTLYSIERVGVASGLKYFKDVDWYERGADWLLEKQQKTGAWAIEFGAVEGTGMALLFLARGRAPVALNKLDWSSGETQAIWNQRPRDAANISRWVGRQVERELNWQAINFKASLDDFHDSPVLYMAGSGEIKLNDEDAQKLRAYIEQGGLILGNADCGNAVFAANFRRLGNRLFPAYEFRELPEAHPIYTHQQYPRTKWRNKPSVQALGNGVREFMLLIPTADAGRVWQLQNTTSKEELWQLAANIVLYSVDRQTLRYRGQTHAIKRDSTVTADRKLTLARLQYEGNWNPEPGGWERLANLMHNQDKVELTIKPVKLGADSLADVKAAHITGTTKFSFNDKQREAIKQFAEAGGLLIVDAAGGSTAFAEAIEAELQGIFDVKPSPLPDSHPIYARADKNVPIVYRDFSRQVLGALKDQGRLTQIEKNGKPAIILSREDLSAGLVGQAVDGIVGYQPAAATELMRQMILHTAGK